MPRLTTRNPSYHLHKPSGRAVVTLNGVQHYLGPWGSKVSRNECDRLVSEWLARGRTAPGVNGVAGRVVSVLIAANWKLCEVHYAGSDGELACTKVALTHLRRLSSPERRGSSLTAASALRIC